jgi:5-methylcytosine-specific restriction protein A
MPSTDDFQAELDSIFSFAEKKRLTAIIIKSGDLHRLVGGYPGTDHRMPLCCTVMRENMMGGDEVLSEPPRGTGATLIIQYRFPRIK